MKIYLTIMVLAIFNLSMITAILPALFSAASYEAVAVGFLSIVVIPIIDFYAVKNIIKQLNNKRKSANEQSI